MGNRPRVSPQGQSDDTRQTTVPSNRKKEGPKKTGPSIKTQGNNADEAKNLGPQEKHRHEDTETRPYILVFPARAPL